MKLTQLLAAVLFSVMCLSAIAADETVTITIDKPQTAVLDPANWTTVYANEKYFDALRPMLVRFPGAAGIIHQKLLEGYTISKAELVLEWDKQEGAGSERGRHGWGAEDAFNKDPGKWSAIARPVLKPWSVDDPKLGPTADSYINGLGFWNHSAARGEGTDRLPIVSGPTPLNADSKIANIDITSILSGSSYGKNIGERLRGIEERGFEVNKNELVDLKYNSQEGGWFDVYSWRVQTGYMKIWVKSPKLTITFNKDSAGARQAGKLPVSIDFKKLVNDLTVKPDGKSSMLPPANWAEIATKYTSKPADMADWQWQRIQELIKIGGYNLGRINIDPLLSLDIPKRDKYLKEILATAPHRWDGHLTSDFALAPNAYPELFPPSVHDHLKLFWDGWLHPETEDTENPRQRSYFRSYNWTLGTQNFNTNSIAGTYLASQYIKAPYPLADAKYGLENILNRIYGFYNGANQEAGDTYYQALSVCGLQMIGKYAKDPYDKLLGQITSEREVEQLISVYNPNLRRITYPMGRGELKYQMLLQDGPYHAVHSLSKLGALIDTDKKIGEEIHHIPVFGTEGLPGRYATLAPWGPDEWQHVVDEKSYPWMNYARVWNFDHDLGPSGWAVHTLGKNYTLASRAEVHTYAGVTPVTAQWRHEEKPVEHMKDLTTLQMSFGINGVFAQSIIQSASVQHKGKLLAMSPLPFRGSLSTLPNPDYAGGWRAKDPKFNPKAFNALSVSLAVMTFGDVTGREVWVNDKKVDQLSGASSPEITDPKYDWNQHMMTTGKNSVFAKESDLIFVKDGVSYAAFRPVTVDPMNRDQQVEIAYEWPILYVNTFIYRDGNGLNLDDWYNAEKKASAGYVIEMGDQSEYGSFDNFRQKVLQGKLTVTRNETGKYYDMSYQNGGDTLEMGFKPWDMGKTFSGGEAGAVYTQVNGKADYGLPIGVQRDTPWSIQGSTGKLEKCGAVLESEPGFRTYLLAEKTSGTYTAYNPIPDPIYLRFTMPDGQTVRADGRLGLTRMRICPKEGKAWIDYQPKPNQNGSDMATAMILTGFSTAPEITYNGSKLKKVPTIKIDGKIGYIVPLANKIKTGKLVSRLKTADTNWQKIAASNAQKTYFQDWYVVGPFENSDYAGENFQLKDFGPEKGLDLKATYTGVKPGEKAVEPTTVQWEPLSKDALPALSNQPVNLIGRFDPPRGIIAYAATTIISDSDRTVQLLTGGDERLGVWVNNQRVVWNKGYRLAYHDQDRTMIKLKKGENSVLLKLGHGYEQWRLYFRLADEYGLPITGVSYKGPHGLTSAGL
jgi:hypothetical protein